jgi:hypothetical protein
MNSEMHILFILNKYYKCLGVNMTQVRERAVEIIQRIPEEKMTFIFNILQNAEK